MSEVIGFSGRIGSGKTTAAELLHAIVPGEKRHLEFSDSVINFAHGMFDQLHEEGVAANADATLSLRALGAMLAADDQADLDRLWAIDTGDLSAYLAAITDSPLPTIHAGNKGDHRPLLQWLGHNMRTVAGDDFWIRQVKRGIQEGLDSEAQLVTLGGIRYEQDTAAVRDFGGNVLRIVRTNHVTDEHQGHASESHLDEWQPDVTAYNDLTEEVLGQKMAILWEDLEEGSLKKQY